MLELFAGCARLTGACAERGLDCTAPIELGLGQWMDLTDKGVQQEIYRWIQSGDIGICWLGTPCKFWLIAKQEKSGFGCRESRQLAMFSTHVILLCSRYNVFYILENPATSKLSEWSHMRRALRKTQAQTITLHMCAFGTSYKKATELAGTLPGSTPLLEPAHAGSRTSSSAAWLSSGAS